MVPTIRWGILGTGWVSGNFARDISLDRPKAKAKHIFQALGTSSEVKGETFLKKNFPDTDVKPTVYTQYSGVYNDPDVDVVYIASPHPYHKRDCLAAIAAGKHVLCEKPMAMNSAQTEEMIAAAKAKGVFLMEGIWTRFLPVFKDMMHSLHEEKVIGDIQRVFYDFSHNFKLDELPPSHRLKDKSLGASALLDLGPYLMTFALLILDPTGSEKPTFKSDMVITDGIDHSNTIIIRYPQAKRHGVLMASVRDETPDTFCRIEASKGAITVQGVAGALPISFIVSLPGRSDDVRKYEFRGMGYYHEADAVAVDIAAGRIENAEMPLHETLKIMRILDVIRKENGLKFDADDW